MTAVQQWWGGVVGSLPGTILSEDFENGIADWTAVGTSTAFFTIASGTGYGDSLNGGQVTPGSSIYDHRVKQYLGADTAFNRFRFKGRLTSDAVGSNRDDGPGISVINRASTMVCGMQLSKESTYDAAMRPLVFMGAETILLGSSRLPTNRWYLFEIAVRTGAGNSSYIVTDIDAGSVWAAGNFAANYGAAVLGSGLRAAAEASIDWTSQPGQIDDIFCYNQPE